jgi:hypothetical protein
VDERLRFSGLSPDEVAHDEWSSVHQPGTTPTNPASIFPNPDSCLRLVSALLTELGDEWLTGGKVYLNLHP